MVTATSKLHRLADVDASSTTFGFRGEALASIANVSLLEIITKAYGRPNGYRKVMKVWMIEYICGKMCIIAAIYGK